MTTIINNPGEGGSDSDSSAIGIIIGVLLVLVLGGILLFYFLPNLRYAKNADTTTEIKIEIPTPATTNTKP